MSQICVTFRSITAAQNAARALEQAGLAPDELDYVLAGDLLNQCIGSSFGLRDFSIPFFGLYGACSTMGESLSLAAMAVALQSALRARRW